MEPAVLDGVPEALEGKLKVVERTLKGISSDEWLHVEPETLNGIEERTVLGQPDDAHPVSEQAQGGQRGCGAMVRGVVHDQDELLMGEFGEQVLQEGDEGI